MPERPRQLLVPIVAPESAPQLLAVAAAVLRASGGHGQVLGVIEMSGGRRIETAVTVARRRRALLQRLVELSQTHGGLTVGVRVAHSIGQGVREAAFEMSADLILAEWSGPGGGRGPAAALIEELVAEPPADLVLVRRHPAADQRRGILVPVRGGASAELSLRTAAAIASARGDVMTAMHVYDPRADPARRAREAEEFTRLVGRLEADVKIVEVDSSRPSAAILAEARRHGTVVLGAYAEVVRSSVLVGSRLALAVSDFEGEAILAKSAPPAAPDAQREPAVRITGDVSAAVDRWFTENTFHAREFRDIDRLVELKRRQGLRLSVALPTLNEEETVGVIVQKLLDDLVRGVPLIDELVVIDSGSTDRTVEIVRRLGIPVHQHRDVLAEYGTFAGKGEALWKSLHVLSGDIIAWCDTDISNFSSRFVYGVVGPLLADARIGYVKGFYRRPLRFGGVLETAGGGRVTELVARPLLNLFYPELSGLLQPLSGEYAARRTVLEQLPFFTGYGVETGHLIDVLENFGLNRIAQVDLGTRIHRNQDLLGLSKMAFAIMQVALKRLGDRHRIHLVSEVNRSLKLIHYEGDRFFLEQKEIEDWERPPMALVPEYLVKHAVRR